VHAKFETEQKIEISTSIVAGCRSEINNCTHNYPCAYSLFNKLLNIIYIDITKKMYFSNFLKSSINN